MFLVVRDDFFIFDFFKKVNLVVVVKLSFPGFILERIIPGPILLGLYFFGPIHPMRAKLVVPSLRHLLQYSQKSESRIAGSGLAPLQSSGREKKTLTVFSSKLGNVRVGGV